MIVADIVEEVGLVMGVPYADIIGPTRTRFVVKARMTAAMVLHKRGMSLSQIGRHLGGRDHSTIIYSLDRVRYMMDKDPEYRSFIEEMASLKHYDLRPRLKLCA